MIHPKPQRWSFPSAPIAVLTLVAMSMAGCGDTNPSTSPDPTVSKSTPSDAPPGPAETAAAAGDDYPMTTCVVSGEPLDIAGRPTIIDFEGREVRFCCNGCAKSFHKEPKKYLAMLDKAAAGDPLPKPPSSGHEGHDHHGHAH